MVKKNKKKKAKIDIEAYKDKPIPNEILILIEQVKDLRPKRVLEHIKEHGYVTTEELQGEHFQYTHGPRAAMDVKEHGIPLKSLRVPAKSTGRPIAAYVFDDISKIHNGKLGGRKPLDKMLKRKLSNTYGTKCMICNEQYELRYLQADHRVPYEVAGENSSFDIDVEKYMLVCASCNRSKSWSCENCHNWKGAKNETLCKECYWCSPVSYKHVAMKEERRLTLIWTELETSEYDHALLYCNHDKEELQKLIKTKLADK